MQVFDLRGRPLTPREYETASLVARGFPNKRIAWEMAISEGTVKQFLCSIFRKTSCANRVELTLWILVKRKIGRVPLS